MASDTGTATPEVATPDTGAPVAKPRRRRGPSKLTLRILAINSVALATLAGGFLYMGRYQDRLIAAELDALTLQARIFASALGEGAVERQERPFGDEVYSLSAELARQMVRRLVETTETRTRLFHASGFLISDSRVLIGSRGIIQIEELPPLPSANPVRKIYDLLYDHFIDLMPSRDAYPAVTDGQGQSRSPSHDALKALNGEISRSVWRTHGADGHHGLLLSVAVPVQRFKQVLGAAVLTRGGQDIDAALRAVRFDILRVFAVALSLTVLLSWFLAGTIARPIKRLAAAAKRVQLGHERATVIPDMSERGDEIGDLSAALREMTEAQWARMDAIERFAADVAHEIKNPLTSLRSAVETVQRITDSERRDRLMAIIADDVQRLDRLITDISKASRLDAELSRDDHAPVDLRALLRAIADVHDIDEGEDDAGTEPLGTDDAPTPPRLVVDLPPGEDCQVRGLEGRLTQVFENLVVNALSFSPPGGTVTITTRRRGATVVTTITDEGPGIPEGKEEAIFERFYSERPAGEKFGTHSGLGLSIARRIVETHGGNIRARNRVDEDGAVMGAILTVELPYAAK